MPRNCVEQEVSTSYFFMKQSAILLSITLLGIAACRPAPTDGANDAGGTASPYLAREVVGVHIAEEFLRDGKLDVTLYQPVARLGYRDYSAVTGVFSLNRPGQS